MLWRILLKRACYLSVVDACLCSYLVRVTNKMHNYYLNVAAWCLCVFLNLKRSTWAYVKCLCLSKHEARYRLTWGVMSCRILRVIVLSDGDDGDRFSRTSNECFLSYLLPPRQMHACNLKKTKKTKKKKKKKKKKKCARQSWVEGWGRWGLMTGFSFEVNFRSGEVTLYYMYDWVVAFFLKWVSLLCFLDCELFTCIFFWRHEIGSLQWRGPIV